MSRKYHADYRKFGPAEHIPRLQIVSGIPAQVERGTRMLENVANCPEIQACAPA